MPSLAESSRPVRPTNPYPADWKAELRHAVRDPYQLCQQLGLPEILADEARLSNPEGFSLLAPRPYVAKMRHGDPNDPLLLQVLPRQGASTQPNGFVEDPVGDRPASRSPGLLQKYAGRALLLASGACAVHCRYCFRQHYPYQTVPHGHDAWNEALTYVESDPSINEIIFSGGDPLMLVDAVLEDLVTRVDAIPHVRRIRFHTRLPVVIPSRVTPRFVEIVGRRRASTAVVLHINHSNEIDSLLVERLGSLRHANVQLLNQSVLLSGVNDDATSLINLSEKLFGAGVLPYYLHRLDRVAGAAHFATAPADDHKLMKAMWAALPGYLVPRFVEEKPNANSKSLIV